MQRPLEHVNWFGAHTGNKSVKIESENLKTAYETNQGKTAKVVKS